MNVTEGLKFIDDVVRICEQPETQAVLESWADDAKAELGSLIAGQRSPDGTPYPPLSQRTIRRKGHNLALIASGRLLESVQGNGPGAIREVTNESVILGTDHRKRGRPIAAYMQYGTGTVPARPFIGVTPDMADSAAEQIADSVITQIDNL